MRYVVKNGVDGAPRITMEQEEILRLVHCHIAKLTKAWCEGGLRGRNDQLYCKINGEPYCLQAFTMVGFSLVVAEVWYDDCANSGAIFSIEYSPTDYKWHVGDRYLTCNSWTELGIDDRRQSLSYPLFLAKGDGDGKLVIPACHKKLFRAVLCNDYLQREN